MSWIQQDAVFWRRTLWENSGGFGEHLQRYARDFYLWQNFAERAELVLAKSYLSCYRYHGSQITANPQQYLEEVRKPDKAPPLGLVLLAFIRGVLGLFPNVFGVSFSNKLLRLGCGVLRVDARLMQGSMVEWSQNERRWLCRRGFL